MQKLFWYQYNKGRTKCCHILKAHKFSLMIYNYLRLNCFSFLMRLFDEYCADLYAFSSFFCHSLFHKINTVFLFIFWNVKVLEINNRGREEGGGVGIKSGGCKIFQKLIIGGGRGTIIRYSREERFPELCNYFYYFTMQLRIAKIRTLTRFFFSNINPTSI